MLSNKILKTKIGEDIYVIPMQNAVSRRVPLIDQISAHKLLAVGTKKFTAERIGSHFIDGELDSANFGYLPFLTKEDAINHFAIESFKQDIKYSIPNDITIEDVNAIKKILEKYKA